jgi:hypothetical protein
MFYSVTMEKPVGAPVFANPLCRLCRTAEADSEEHVIPSAIGGRLVALGVLCTGCNGHLGSTVDAAFAKQFEVLRMMLGIEGDRGQSVSIRAADVTGRDVFLDPGMQLRAAPNPPAILREDEQGYEARFDSLEQARAFAESVQRKNPARKVEVTSVTESIVFPGPINLALEIGGPAVLRSAVKSTLSLLAARGVAGPPEVLARAWSYVGGALEEKEAGVAVHHAAAPSPWTPASLGTVSHRIAARSNVARGFVEADVRYFGEIGFVIRIACAIPDAISIAYGVDPLSGADADSDDWAGAIGIPFAADSTQIYRSVERAFVAICARAAERETQGLSREITERAVRRALETYPNVEPRDLFNLLLRRLIAEDIARVKLRHESSSVAPELLPRVQPRRKAPPP